VQYTAKLLVYSVFAAVLLAADTPTVVSSFQPESATPDVVTNDGLVVLSEAGFSDSFIVEKISLSRTRFDVTAEGLAGMRRKGISEELVTFVLRHSAKGAVAQTAAPAPIAVPMKLVKMNVLVPLTNPVSASPLALPASPALSGPASMPVMSPMGSQYIWVATR
jgi:hypothetical protein